MLLANMKVSTVLRIAIESHQAADEQDPGTEMSYETARIKPTTVQVESHLSLPETDLLEFCKYKGLCLGVRALGS